MNKIYLILLVVISLYTVLLIAAYFLQEKFIFLPEKLDANYQYNLSPGDTEIFIKSIDGEQFNAIYYTRPNTKYVVLYFHGNGGSLNSWQNISPEILTLNCNLLLTDYRGYGKSTTRFSEEGFYNDAQAAYNFLKTKGYKDEQIIIYGRSLGSGVAVDLASKNNPNALILETPYTSVSKVASEQTPYFLPFLTLKYKFNSLEKAARILCPTIILHGDKDEFIPCQHGQILYDALTCKKQIVIIKNGMHHNLSTFPEKALKLHSFIENL